MMEIKIIILERKFFFYYYDIIYFLIIKYIINLKILHLYKYYIKKIGISYRKYFLTKQTEPKIFNIKSIW